MKIETVEDTDKALSILLDWTLQNNQLLETLKNGRDSAIRWLSLEKVILENMPINNVNVWNWEPGSSVIYRIRDRFFYEMQKKTNLDFGFCQYFVPAWRNIAEYFLTNHKTDPEKNFNLCTVGGIDIYTICEGTDNNCCVHLPESEKKKIIIDEEYKKVFIASNNALQRAINKEVSKN